MANIVDAANGTTDPVYISVGDYFKTLLDHVNGIDTSAPNYEDVEPLPRFWSFTTGTKPWPPDKTNGITEDIWYPFETKGAKTGVLGGPLGYFYVPFNWEFWLCPDDLDPGTGACAGTTFGVTEGPYEGLGEVQPSSFTAALKSTDTAVEWSKYKWVKLHKKKTFDKYVLEDICWQGSSFPLGDKWIGGTFTGRGQDAENVLQVGSLTCDALIENDCKSMNCQKDPLTGAWGCNPEYCWCYCEQRALENEYPKYPNVASSVLCFGPHCRTQGYVTQDMKDSECSPPFCYDVIRNMSKDIQDRHHTHIWCNDQWVPVPPPTPTVHPTKTPGDDTHHPSDSPTWIYWVVGSGVVALAILVALLIVFIRRKK